MDVRCKHLLAKTIRNKNGWGKAPRYLSLKLTRVVKDSSVGEEGEQSLPNIKSKLSKESYHGHGWFDTPHPKCPWQLYHQIRQGDLLPAVLGNHDFKFGKDGLSAPSQAVLNNLDFRLNNDRFPPPHPITILSYFHLRSDKEAYCEILNTRPGVPGLFF